jgi:hypothetical protein
MRSPRIFSALEFFGRIPDTPTRQKTEAVMLDKRAAKVYPRSVADPAGPRLGQAADIWMDLEDRFWYTFVGPKQLKELGAVTGRSG